jgi:glycerophosphoryl diester phosphodiesterase
MEAFEAAIKLGADGIELDVQETADNAFIVFHDDRLHGTEIKKLSLEQVRNIKLQGDLEIPTLEQALDLCHQNETGYRRHYH